MLRSIYSRNMRRIAYGSAALVTLAAAEGLYLRESYKRSTKLSGSTGPNNGWFKTAFTEKKGVIDKLDNIKKEGNTILVVLGDSLVAGVGCENSKSSSILTETLAETLHLKTKKSIRWLSESVIGGSIHDIKLQALPKLLTAENRAILKNENDENTIVFVVIFGFNDIKNLVFGNNNNENSLTQSIHGLIQEIKQVIEILGYKQCKIYLPNIPLGFLLAQNIPEFSLNVFPLNYFATFVLDQFEEIKRNCIEKYELNKHMYLNVIPFSIKNIEKEDMKNIVSADGVHPNSKGYRLWARVISSQIEI